MFGIIRGYCVDGAGERLPDFFISRAGANPHDVAMATRIGQVLEGPEHQAHVFLQQWDMANKNFMERVDYALRSGAHVIAILSPEYLKTDYCQEEWEYVLRRDPLNRQGRLIVLRCAPCEPLGRLANIAYWDVVKLNDDDVLLAEMVKLAVMPDAARRKLPPTHSHWRTAAKPVLHADIRPTHNFTGRDAALLAIDGALWSGAGTATAITQPAAVTGLGGVGKSAIAREYGWQARDGYTGVWWIDAATVEAGGDGAIQRALVELGDHYQPGLSAFDKREQAARHVADVLLASEVFDKPWLVIFDNIDDPAALERWRPKGNVHALFTSRLDRWGTSVKAVEIDSWPIDEAVKYLRAEADRPDLDDAGARAIATELGGLPLALSHAATYLRDNTLATAENYLSDIAGHMRDAPPDAPYGRAVFATFMQQVQQAEKRGPGATALLSLAAFVAPDGIPVTLFRQTPESYPDILRSVLETPSGATRALGLWKSCHSSSRAATVKACPCIGLCRRPRVTP